MKKIWNEQTKFEKILTIFRVVVYALLICASIMKFLNLRFKALNLAIPLFAAYYLLETIYNWKTDKDMAAISLLMTIIIFAVGCALLFNNILL